MNINGLNYTLSTERVDNYKPNNGEGSFEKKITSKAIDILREVSDSKPNNNLIRKIKAISEEEIQQIPTIIKILQYALHYLSFGSYESEYIISSKLKQAAKNFLKIHSLPDENVGGNVQVHSQDNGGRVVIDSSIEDESKSN